MPIWRETPTAILYHGDCKEELRSRPDNSVHVVVTSPPYWQLRDYEVEGQLGLEPTPEEYIAALVEVFREVRRVLRPDGFCWVNLGDSYAGSGRGGYQGGKSGLQGSTEGQEQARIAKDTLFTRHQETMFPAFRDGQMGRNWVPPPAGLKQKDMLGLPWMLAFALRNDGWFLRADVVWHKRSAMPSSVIDRPGTAHEYVFLLAKSRRYFYDQMGSEEECTGNAHSRGHGVNLKAKQGDKSVRTKVKQNESFSSAVTEVMAKRNMRSVWSLSSFSFKGKHFACVDDQTEALTPRGWKRHHELADGELIATYCPEKDRLFWSAAQFYRYDFDGELIGIDKRDTSQMLTPNHRCLIKSQKGRVRCVLAEDLKGSHRIPVTAPLEVEQSDGVGLAMASLLGWYVSEGEQKRHRVIRINQSVSANPRKVEEIRGVLASLDAEFSERVRHRTVRGKESVEVIFSVKGAVAERLFELSPRKEIDWSWLNWPRDQIAAFLVACIKGDGHWRADGRTCVVQKSKAFQDVIQAMAIRLGKRCHLSPRKEKDFVAYITERKWLWLRGTNGQPYRKTMVPYSGKVWCPSVSTGYWLARREGKPFITGNTFPPELVRRCLLPAPIEKGCCAKCGAAWARIFTKTRTPTRPGTKSKVKRPDRWQDGDGAHDTLFHNSTESEHPKNGRAGQHADSPYNGQEGKVVGNRDPQRHVTEKKTEGWWPRCRCYGVKPAKRSNQLLSKTPQFDATLIQRVELEPCVVMDVFHGAGTTMKVCERFGMKYVGYELSEEYLVLSVERPDVKFPHEYRRKSRAKPKVVNKEQNLLPFMMEA